MLSIYVRPISSRTPHFDSNNVLAPIRLPILLGIVHIYVLGRLLGRRASAP